MSAVPADDLAKRSEIGPLAADLALAYGRMVRFYRDQMEMSGPAADARARGADDSPVGAATDLARIQDQPPDQVSWFDLNRVADRDPEALSALWRDLRAAAQDELDSGHRTARALDWDGRPWERARFLAIRDSFRADYLPAPGIETALLELAAEAFGDYLSWTELLHQQAGTEVDLERHDLLRHGKWKPQRIASAEAMANSSRMADRAHARFLQTVAALEARRRAEPSMVGHAGHVHISVQHLAIIPFMDGLDAPGQGSEE